MLASCAIFVSALVLSSFSAVQASRMQPSRLGVDAEEHLDANISHSEPKCESWCAKKVATQEKTCKSGGKSGQTCTWDILCGYSSQACSACGQCAKDAQCLDYCDRKVTQKLKECKKDGKENQICTWDIVCGWSSKKCSKCTECSYRCEDFCAAKANKGEETWSTMCKWSTGKCAACEQCKSSPRPTPKPTPRPTPKPTPRPTPQSSTPKCESWCATKISEKKRDCTSNGKTNQLCTWDILCGYSSKKCAACSQCKAASDKNIKSGTSGRAVVGTFLVMSCLLMNMF